MDPDADVVAGNNYDKQDEDESRRSLCWRRKLCRGEGVTVTHWVIKREANANQQRGADVSRKRKLRRRMR